MAAAPQALKGAEKAEKVVEPPRPPPIPVRPIIRLKGDVGTEEDAFKLLRFLDLKVVDERGSGSGGWIWTLEGRQERGAQLVIRVERTPRNAMRLETKFQLLLRTKLPRRMAAQIGAKVAGQMQEAAEEREEELVVDTEAE